MIEGGSRTRKKSWDGEKRKGGGEEGPPLPHGFTLEIVLDVSPNATGEPVRQSRRSQYNYTVICKCIKVMCFGYENIKSEEKTKFPNGRFPG